MLERNDDGGSGGRPTDEDSAERCGVPWPPGVARPLSGVAGMLLRGARCGIRLMFTGDDVDRAGLDVRRIVGVCIPASPTALWLARRSRGGGVGGGLGRGGIGRVDAFQRGRPSEAV